MEVKKHKRLTLKERVQIETLLNENNTKAYIAKRLDRSRSTISREVNKWVQNKYDKYEAHLAQWCAKDDYLNKRNLDKISTYSLLRFFVYKGLLSQWTPEQISGRIKELYPNDPIMSISHEAIYKHIYTRPQASLNKKLIKLLVRKKTRRRPSIKRRGTGSKIINQVSIDLRPKHIELRKEVGHWEGDLVIGKGQKSAIGTIVERKSRYTLIIKLNSRKSDEIAKMFSMKLNQLNNLFKKTMTYDNGIEMAKHEKITQNTGMKIFFAHPYSSWERGTNENTNGLIRRYLPKGTDFNLIDEKLLMQIQLKLNNRPRKIIGFKTPQEIMDSELKNVA
ncbi:Transposase and inactivated derivatives, IS30 family [Flaviramulus basaltis]|uniref:Transposase and inactivated derivatives, IS30 family n=1 Tax=Flaviramulus basaltis TaxID=369401 RepID=A0A1K2ISA0_9FLAO|nr:IS30 family transposase [Flaviramulus basaltis]SFZ95332.1 Transposase and inactivated derivatives, IS30 family [Flaviramulus basaltis]